MLAPLALLVSASSRLVVSPPVPGTRAVSGVHVLHPHRIAVADQAKRNYRPGKVRWPSAGSATVTLAASHRVQAANLPIWAEASDTALTGLRVRMLDRTATAKAGVNGVLFSVTPSAGQGDTRIAVDYSGFANAYGGDYGGRLRLVRMPACAITSPSRPACRVRTPLPSTNSPAKREVSAFVHLQSTTVLAAVSGTDSSTGSFAATSLKAAGSWSAGGSTGSFDYSYPISLPSASSSAVPSVTLSYDSGSVDGQTATTNTQSSWVGDGWSMADSYVEQTFAACSDSPEGSASPVSSPDACYDGPILTMSLNGSSSALVWDASKQSYALSDNHGETISHVTGSNNGSGTHDTDYWLITDRDGTRYYFGRNQLPGWTSGATPTNSVDSEPVYSAHSTDPCYSSSGFASSVCTMAYRWHLDYMVDAHNNAVAYYYKQDTNLYGANNGTTNRSYVRDSHLDRIDYGFRDGGAYQTVPDQVTFTASPRCVATTCDPLSKSTAATEYPDVPYDLTCASGATCASQAPAFFSTVRLTAITAQQYSAAASTYVPVDTYTLTQTEPPSGDSMPATLWLASIGHTGKDTNAGATDNASVPEVTFAGQDLPNRVDNRNFPALYRYRISAVTSELGAVTAVTYDLPNPCDPTSVASLNPSTNTNSCYPIYWTPQDYAAPVRDWFNKWAVTEVKVSDATGGALQEHNVYTYNGGAAWHYDDNEVTKPQYRTWGQFRGYASVETRTGDGTNDRQTSAVTSYYRGMDGDWLSPTSTRSVSVTDSQGGIHPDSDQLAGSTLETTTYRGAGGPVDHSTITSYWVSTPAATRSRTGLPALVATTAATAETWTRQALTDGGATTWRYTETDTSYNATVSDPNFGLLTASYTHTVPANPSYDQCTTYTYAAPNPSNNLTGLPSSIEQDSVACGGFTEAGPASVPAGFNTLTAPASVVRPDQVVSATRTYYDDPTFATGFPQASPPTVGDATMVRTASGYSGGAFTWQTTGRSTFDMYGRVLNAYDGNGNLTTTSYTVNSVGLTTAAAVTNALNQTATTTLDPERNLALVVTDPNGVAATTHYDALGRLTDVWQNSRTTGSPANLHYTYTVSNNSLSGVQTDKLNNESGYITSYSIADSLGRVRQTQTPTPQGGRLVSESFYDSRGWVWKKNTNYWDKNATPALTLIGVADDQVDNQDRYTYDGLGRAVVADSEQRTVVKQHTVTVYSGDTTTVIPPTGGVTKATTTDPLGRASALTEYSVAPTLSTPADTFTGPWYVTGGTPVTTSYRYDGHGKQYQTIDASGATWTDTYNLLGQVVSKNDPDGGTSTLSYDNNGNLTQTTDARSSTISATYDARNRKTGQYAAPVAQQSSTNQLASWVYDNSNNAVSNMTYPIGQLTTSTAYNNGKAYTTQALGFNIFGDSLGQTVTIPAGEGSLTASYQFKHSYTGPLGLPDKDTYPGGGGLPLEIVGHGYLPPFDLPSGLSSITYNYAYNVIYTALSQVGQEQIGGATNSAWITNKFDDHTGALTDQAITHAAGGASPSPTDEQAYTYDPAGNLTSQTETRLGNSSATETQCYRYDGLGRLKTAWTATDNCTTTPTAGNSGMVGDNLGAASAYWTTWTFDNLGNRTGQTQHVTAAGGSDTTTTYSYDTNNAHQPHTLTATSLTGATTGSTSYSYDAAGNMISRATADHGNQTITWDPDGRVSQISDGTKTTSFVYDADGNILLQKDPGSTVLYLPGEQLTLNTATSTVTGIRYYPLPGGGMAYRTGTGTNYGFEIADPHNTATLSLDSTAQNPTWRQFDVYGNPRGPAVSWADNRGFLNQPVDQATGLNLLGARQYDPTTARFISLDPVLETSDPQQLNGYSYARNAPTNGSDPDGTCIALDGGGCAGTAAQADEINDKIDTKLHNVDVASAAAAASQSRLQKAFAKTFRTGSKVCKGREYQCKDAVAKVNSGEWTVLDGLAHLACDSYALNGHCPKNGPPRWYVALLDITVAGPAAVCGAAWEACVGAGEAVALDEAASDEAAAFEARTQGIAAEEEEALADSAGLQEAAAKDYGDPGKAFIETLGEECVGGNSFTPDTPVLMADGHTKPIKDVKVGDKVLATDPTTGKTTAEPVTALHDNHDTDLTDLTVTDDHGHISVIHTTQHHLFFSMKTRTWSEAGNLAFATQLYTRARTVVRVLAVRNLAGANDMRNLTVRDLHTYYVVITAALVLVHNDNCELPEGYTSAPALEGDPYHPDSVAARSAENTEFYNPIRERAARLGYTNRIPPQRAPFDSHGQAVFSNGRNYITRDVDEHNVSNGWKMFNRRGERIGTYDAELNYVGP